MNTNAQVFILCEDTVHYHFARKYFELLGFAKRKIRGDYNPKGRSTGSGAEFVKTRYETEVKAFRSKTTYQNYVLVVIIDDDTKDNAKNLKPIPSADETILIFSPVRNIESWFYYIDTGDINIEIPGSDGKIKDYSPQYKNKSRPTDFAKKLKNEICVNGLLENAPASLICACNELKRLKN